MAANTETGERIFRGIAASPGVTQGKILVLDKGQEQRPHRRVLRMEETNAELQRFKSALVETRRELRDIRETVSKRLGARDAQIFDAHLLVLEDPVLIDQVTNMVLEERVNAEFAFHEVITQYTRALSEVQDDYLRERAADIQDVSDRVLGHLAGRSHAIDLKHLDEPCIIISHDLKPGHTFHPKGQGNGYVVTLGGARLYFSGGRLECAPEVLAVTDIDVAFLSMNLPLNRMTPLAGAECVKVFKPKIVYLYHYRDANLEVFRDALEGLPIDVRLANWYPEQ